MPALQKKDLGRLLSGRNEPSVLEKEALFAELERKLPQSVPSRLWFGAAVGGLLSLCGVTAAVVLGLRPLSAPSGEVPTSSPGSGDWVARGGPTENAPSVRLFCLEGTQEKDCAVGRTLAFELQKLPEQLRYYAAFARAPNGSILWYFPGAKDTSPLLDRSHGIQRQAIPLEPPHTPGEYEVFTVFSENPVGRSELKAALGPSLASTARLVVVRRRVILQDHP